MVLCSKRRQGPWDPTYRFATSWLFSAWTLFAYRAIASVFIFATRILALAVICSRCTPAHEQFSYFTQLTNFGQAFYFAFAALHTGSYAARGRPFLASWPRFLQTAHSVFYTTIIVFPPIVTIVYWVLLGPDGPYESTFLMYLDISQHAVNSFFVVTELFLTRTERRSWWHAIPIVVFLGMYLGLAYLTHALQGFFVYSFLDPQEVGGNGAVAGYIVGILAAGLIVFAIANGLIVLRRWLTEDKMGMHGKFVARHVGRTDSYRVADAEAGKGGIAMSQQMRY